MNDDSDTRQGTLKFQMYAKRVSEAARAGVDSLARTKQDEKLVTSPEEQKILSSWRYLTYGWAGGAGLITIIAARCPPWPLSNLLSAVLGAGVGTLAGITRGIREAPVTLSSLIDNRAPSDMVDVIICPALKEWQGCIDDDSCKRALQSAAAAFKDKDCILDLVYRCKARSNGSPVAAGSFNDTAVPGDDFEQSEDQLSHFDFPPPPSNDAADD